MGEKQVIWDQTLALCYKNLLHIKRRFASFLCMLLTPFLVVGIMMTLNYLIARFHIADKLKNSDLSIRGKVEIPDSLPKYMIPCNLNNREMFDLHPQMKDFYQIRAWHRYVRYGLNERTTQSKYHAKQFFRKHPFFIGYGPFRSSPFFIYSEVDNNKELNDNLVLRIQILG